VPPTIAISAISAFLFLRWVRIADDFNEMTRALRWGRHASSGSCRSRIEP
jgi:hypothetical protein